MEDSIYKLQYGTIEEVLNGNGWEVENYEQLWCSGKNNSIFIPKFIGVYQDSQNRKIIPEKEEMIRTIFKMTYGEEEKIHPDLISLIYDPDVTNSQTTRMFLSKDISSRISAFGYKEAPEFNKKKLKEQQIELLKEFRDENGFINEEEFIKESYKNILINKEKYGLNREEQTTSIVLDCKLKFSQDFQNTSIIKNPNIIQIAENLIKNLDDLLN